MFGGYDLKCFTSSLTNLLNSIDECISRTRPCTKNQDDSKGENLNQPDTNAGTVYVFTGNSSMCIGQQTIHHGDININITNEMDIIDDGTHCDNSDTDTIREHDDIDARMRFFNANSP